MEKTNEIKYVRNLNQDKEAIDDNLSEFNDTTDDPFMNPGAS